MSKGSKGTSDNGFSPKIASVVFAEHFGRAVPSEAAIEFTTASNAEIGEFRERQIDAMRFPGIPTLVRCSNSRTKGPISEQFHYSYLGSEPPGDAVFKIRFHQALIAASTVILEFLKNCKRREAYNSPRRQLPADKSGRRSANSTIVSMREATRSASTEDIRL